MRYLRLREALDLYQRITAQTGGAAGLRDLGALQSAIAQIRMGFGGQDLYPTLAEKAAALAFTVITNHPFLDGNKPADHAFMETFQVINGYELVADVAEQERVVLSVAAGDTDRSTFTEWVQSHAFPMKR